MYFRVERCRPWPATLAGLLLSLALHGCGLQPTPLDGTARAEFAADKNARVVREQEPVTGAVSLYEAMARALKYNLDYHVEMMQKSLKIKELDLATYKMLPSVIGSTGRTERSNDAGGSSKSLLTGKQSLEPSTSQPRTLVQSDLTFSWNILDLGLSYVRARQSADEALIAEETKRKVIARVIEDVRSAYWRAVSSERLTSQLRRLEHRVQAALASSRVLSQSLDTSPITALTYERELVDIKREIQRLEGELKVAKLQLAALMNLRPGTPFQLVHDTHADRAPPAMSPEELTTFALENRPELQDVAYRSRINQHEAHAALLELLPGIQLFASTNNDSNDFLFNHDWATWGTKVGWNVVRLFQYPARRGAIEAQDALLDQRALALTMAIMTQVHVSRVRYAHSRRELATAREYLDVQRRLIEQIRKQAASDKVSEQTLIREEMNALVAEVKRDIAYANMQNALGAFFTAIGRDLAVETRDPDESVQSLTAKLRSTLNNSTILASNRDTISTKEKH